MQTAACHFDYQVISKLGEGGQGVVHLVKEISSSSQSQSPSPSSCRLFARKRLSPCRDLKDLNHSLGEVQAMLRFSHPFIVSTEKFYLDEETSTSTLTPTQQSTTPPEQTADAVSTIIYIIYEFCDKGNLRDFVDRCRYKNHIIPIQVVLRWFRQMALAVQYIVAKGFIHRDLKPGNVFLCSNSTPRPIAGEGASLSVLPSLNPSPEIVTKIGDFGFAKHLSGTKTTDTVLGSRNFLSPEMKRQTQYDSKVDIWGLSCILLELLLDRSFDYAYQALENRGLLLEMIRDRYSVILMEDGDVLKDDPAAGPTAPSENEEEEGELNDTVLREDPKSSKIDLLLEFVDRIFVLEARNRPTAEQVVRLVDELLPNMGISVSGIVREGQLAIQPGSVSQQTEEDGQARADSMSARVQDMGGLLGSEGGAISAGRSVLDSTVGQIEMLHRDLFDKDEQIYFLKEDLKEMSRRYFAVRSILQGGEEEPEQHLVSSGADVGGSLLFVRSHSGRRGRPIDVFPVRDFATLGNVPPKNGKNFDVVFANWKKRDMVVALKRLSTAPIGAPTSPPRPTRGGTAVMSLEEFREQTGYDHWMQYDWTDAHNVERIFGIVHDKRKKEYGLIAEGFVNENLERYLRNYNFKLEIWGKIRLCFAIAQALVVLHRRHFVHVKELSLRRITVSRNPMNQNRKRFKIIGPFRKVESSEFAAACRAEIRHFFSCMEGIFTRCGMEKTDLEPSNAYEAEFLDVMRLYEGDKNVTARNLTYRLNLLVEKQWDAIQEIARQKKSEGSDESRLLLRDLKTTPSNKIPLS